MDARDIYQFTPFLIAAENSFYQSVKKLIDRGSSIEAVDHDGYNALHLAVAERTDLRVINLLIRHKIGIDFMDLDGNTALHIAVWNTDTDVVSL